MNYNKKVSGAKAVIVPITKIGKNMLPYVEDLSQRVIKYVDFYPTMYLPESSLEGVQSSSDMFLNLLDTTGNAYLVKDMPLDRYNYAISNGRRESIFSQISLQNSYIDCQDPENVGKNVLLVFWYDLPEFSKKNSTDVLITDAISIPITTVYGRNILGDEERMANKRFRSILMARPSVLPDFTPGLGYGELDYCFITLRKGSYNVIENVPLVLFYQADMIERTEFANIVFDMQNSYITIGGAGTVDTPEDYVGKNILLNVVYEK